MHQKKKIIMHLGHVHMHQKKIDMFTCIRRRNVHMHQ
jgi:hypothetical protein